MNIRDKCIQYIKDIFNTYSVKFESIGDNGSLNYIIYRNNLFDKIKHVWLAFKFKFQRPDLNDPVVKRFADVLSERDIPVAKVNYDLGAKLAGHVDWDVIPEHLAQPVNADKLTEFQLTYDDIRTIPEDEVVPVKIPTSFNDMIMRNKDVSPEEDASIPRVKVPEKFDSVLSPLLNDDSFKMNDFEIKNHKILSDIYNKIK